MSQTAVIQDIEDPFAMMLPEPVALPVLEPEVKDRRQDEEDPARADQVDKMLKRIRADKAHFASDFKRMRRDMYVATHGCEKTWPEDAYRANICGRHAKQKTSALYAKNPKISARRRESLDFMVWDENPNGVMAALQVINAANEAMSMAPPMVPSSMIDPATGGPMMMPGPAPQLPPGYEQAMELMQDYQQGMDKRQKMQRFGKTLEMLYTYAMGELRPLPFKTAMKHVVRRAVTTGVGYVKLAYAREYGPPPGVSDQLADYRSRIAHLELLASDLEEGDLDEDAAERAELELAITALEGENEVVTREGLIFDFPLSTRIIPDSNCQKLTGFIGSRHLTIEHTFTLDEVRKMFPDGNVEKEFTPYKAETDDAADAQAGPNYVVDESAENGAADKDRTGLVRVYEHYDKTTGLCYFLAEGVKRFLREPAAPDVFVEQFWPVYSLTFNDVENEDKLFPPSDVSLMLPMQNEYNRARQGMREHRDAARPRWMTPNGVLEEEDKNKITRSKPFDLISLNVAADTDMRALLQVIPVPGVDPNLYETNPLFTDIQFVVGTQESSFGGLSQATATESAIAANASQSSDGSSIDDLDAFLSLIARDGGIILAREMSQQQAEVIVGPGAYWPEMTLQEIASEISLEVAAGSTGKPNQAVEVNAWQQLMPFLQQTPGLDPIWLLKETLRRLDDRLDVTDAISAGLPSIVAQNAAAGAQAQAGGGMGAPADPSMQGAEGANPTVRPGEPSGSGPAFGSNQV